MEKIIEISNPNKIVYPEDEIKKIDVVKYYADVAEIMMPFLSDRLLSVIRCHDGVKGECFFKKHPASDKDVEIFRRKGEDYFYIRDISQIVYQAQMGTIEFHGYASKVTDFNRPDVMTFDLDPDEGLPFEKLVLGVKKIKSVLEGLSLQCFLKTSGGKGYHVVVPFKKSNDWKSFYGFARNVALFAEKSWPEEFTSKLRKSERKGRIFLDFMRNNEGSTCVLPYSLRARKGATVSMPIRWEDVGKIRPDTVNIKNYKKYLNDSWKEFFKLNQQLK